MTLDLAMTSGYDTKNTGNKSKYIQNGLHQTPVHQRKQEKVKRQPIGGQGLASHMSDTGLI